MAIKKVKLPNNTVVDINDSRIPGVDSTPTSGSTNVVTSGGVHTAISDAVSQIINLGSITTTQDGTVEFTLLNGDTVIVDFNHTHYGLLPNVTTTDNGKTLMVVAGTWTVTPNICQTTDNLVTSLSSSSTDAQYPSAKCMYDLLGDVESLINAL